MKNNFGLFIIIVICLSALGLVYFAFYFTQNTESANELEPQSKSQKPSSVSSTKIKSDQNNVNVSDSTVPVIDVETKNDTESKNQKDLKGKPEVIAKEKSITVQVPEMPAKPVKDMVEEELIQQLQIKNEPELLMEVVNRFSTINKISDKSIDQLKGFIGKKNADVDAYIIKTLSKKAIDRDDVLSDLISILKTSNNRVIRRCAADAIGEFKNADQKLTELNSILEKETDERVKLKLNQTIHSINAPKSIK